MEGASKRRGRPSRAPEPGERVKLGLRVTPKLKQSLDTAAQNGGRSQSQEAEFRLEQSFDRGDLLSDALTLAYSPELAGLLLTIAAAIDNAARSASRAAPEDARHWSRNAYVFAQTEQAVLEVMKAFRPEGAAVAPSVADAHRLGWKAARQALLAIAGDEKRPKLAEALKLFFDRPHRVDAEKIRFLLGPMAKAIKVPKA
jgi:hypothetical protein